MESTTEHKRQTFGKFKIKSELQFVVSIVFLFLGLMLFVKATFSGSSFLGLSGSVLVLGSSYFLICRHK